MADIYNNEVYKKFVEELRRILDNPGPNIKKVDLDWLRPRALPFGQKTKYGSYGFRSAVSSRMADKTVYLGPERIRLPNPLPSQKAIVEKAPEELEKVLHLMRTLPFFHLRRQMGDNSEFNPMCNLYVCLSDIKNYRLGYMWGNTMAAPTKRPGPEFTMLHIPEEHSIRQQVLTLPDDKLNICLGSDYMGEDKKGFLRQGMWCADELGMLGLHAGTKVVIVRDPVTDQLKRYGVIIFGLTATGKSTWSCHQLFLDHSRGEGTQVAQDDIVFLKKDGSALGTELGFYVKTDVIPDQQEAMYHALIDPTCLLENVFIDSKGEIKFLDESLCGNGRAIVQRDKLKIERDGKMIGISAPTINLPPLTEMDGLVFAFITRRHTMMSYAQELTPEQGCLAYLWGESTHSMGTNPAKAGESVRIVGTDDFIVGSRARKVNRFYEMAMTLCAQFPGKVRFFQYNTGGMGELIQEETVGGVKKKKVLRKVDRVPLELMAAIQRGDLRQTNRYEKGILGTRQVSYVEGHDLAPYDPNKFYSKEQIQGYIEDLVKGRRAFTEEIAREGLRDEVMRAAERSFRIVPTPSGTAIEGTPEPEVQVAVDIDLKSRPKRPIWGRWR